MIDASQLSGGDRVFVEISKRLDPNNFVVDVVTTKAGNKLWAKSSNLSRLVILPSAKLERSLGREGVPLVYLIRSLVALVRTCHLLSRDSPIVLYSSSDFYPDVLPAFIMRKLFKNAKWVSRVYHIIPPPSQRKGSFVLNLLSFISQRTSLCLMKMKSNLIIGLNGSIRNELAALGFPLQRLAVSGAGIDTELINSVGPASVQYDAVFLGRIHPNKGIFDVIEAWKAVVSVRKGARLVIIGGGDTGLITLLKRKILEYNLTENVDYVGFIEDDRVVYGIMKSSKLFIFTDHEAGWSLATCEAMACGLPVVGYDLQIFGSIFKKGFVTVPLFDTKELADRVLLLIENEQLRTKLQVEAKQQAQLFDWKRVADDFAPLIYSITD